MASSSNNGLVRVLLWWVTVLSVSQAVLLVLFLTMGNFGQLSSELGDSSDKARMFSFKATEVHNRSVMWYAVKSADLPIGEGHPGVLRIEKDGYFFMCLRVTLGKCGVCEAPGTQKVEVGLFRDGESVLSGWIDKRTWSTGLLCKTERLTAGSSLRVEIQTSPPADPSSIAINDSMRVSYLDVIYMPD